ncbi:MAG TPA: hypothetical protein VGQ81_08475 [Acidobacteriota bacterium]|nr:hypothetical protein [Acidobacteriota bacterium]
MWKFYRALIRPAAKEFWTATDEVLTGIAILFFIILLLNRKLGEHVMTAWNGISAWWSAIPIALIVLYRLLRANYEQFAAMKQERDDARADLATSTKGLPVNRPKIAIDSYKENPTDGYGVTVGNDGYAAYEVAILKTQIGVTDYSLAFHEKAASMPHRAREFFVAKIEPTNDYGNQLLKAMLVAELAALNIEIIYTDLEYRGGKLLWYKTTIALERNETEASGLRPRFISQELIPDPFKSGGIKQA